MITMMKRKKFADGSDREEIYDSNFKKIDIKGDSYLGAASLLDITKVGEKKWIADKNGEKQIIVDIGYKWVTLFPKNENYVVIAVYNSYSELIHIKFDIAKKVVYKGNKPCYDDLFLDIIMGEDDYISFIGEDELEIAYKSQIIKPKDYQIARKTADKIVNKFHKKSDFHYLKQISDKYFAELSSLIEQQTNEQI